MARHSLQHYVPFISAWPCNTALPNGTLAIRRSFSYLQRASFGSTSQWKRWWQTLQQSLCPWTSFYHRWSSSTQWHGTHCGTMFPSYQHALQHSASQWNASDQMRIFFSTESIFAQHFTMETLMANAAAMPVSLWQAILTSLHVMYHQVCVCVCVFGQVVWFEFVGTSQQLNAAFGKQFLHLCTYHQVCMCVCVCVASARLCDLSLSDLVSNQTQLFANNSYIFACTMSYLNTFSSATKRCKRNDLPKSSPQGWGHKITKAPRLSQLGVVFRFHETILRRWVDPCGYGHMSWDHQIFFKSRAFNKRKAIGLQ